MLHGLDVTVEELCSPLTVGPEKLPGRADAWMDVHTRYTHAHTHTRALTHMRTRTRAHTRFILLLLKRRDVELLLLKGKLTCQAAKLSPWSWAGRARED